MAISLKDIFRTLTASFLFYLSFPNIISPAGFPLLSACALVPLFFSFEQKNLLQRISLGLLFGTAGYACLVSWSFAVSPVLFGLFVAGLNVQMLLFAFAYPRQGISRKRGLVFIAALWAVSEWLRSYVLGGFAWSFGNALSCYPALIQIADVTGSRGLAFVLVWVNACFYGMIRYPQRRRYYIIMVMCAVAIVAAYGTWSLAKRPAVGNQDKYVICTVEPHIAMSDKTDPSALDRLLEEHIELSRLCVTQKEAPDVIVWPETAVPEDIVRDAKLNQRLRPFIEDIKANVLVGTALLVDGKNYNSAVLFDDRAQAVNIYHKRYLIPFMEFWRRPGESFTAGDVVQPFPALRQGGRRATHRFGVAICSEDHYPRLFRKWVRQGVDFMMVMLNDAWFLQKEALTMHLQSSILRAVEYGLPLVRATNSGISVAIDAHGIMADSSVKQNKVYRYSIQPGRSKTIYGQFGDIFSVMCLGFVIIEFVLKLRNVT